MKTKNGGGENLFSPAPLFFVFPDAMHPAGGIYAAQPVAIHTFPTFQREIVCQKSLFVPLLGPGSMTLVRGLGLNKPHTFPMLHWHASRLESSIKIQYDFLGRGCGGNRSQEQTRRVCDAADANNADGGSIRKRSAGYAIRSKPRGFVTRQRSSTQTKKACASSAQGMRCHFKEWFPPHHLRPPPAIFPKLPKIAIPTRRMPRE